MKPTSMILIALVVAAAIAVIALRPARSAAPPGPAINDGPAPASVAAPAARPRLLDLGAGKCIPCQLMEPILVDLRTEYGGALQVDFIDVWKDSAAGQVHGIRTIPTQIFFTPDGKELFRHEGFMAKADILGQWKVLGYDLTPASAR